MTLDEARALAALIAGGGPDYEAWNLSTVLDELAESGPHEGKVKHAYLRSVASAELGGPEVFNTPG
jgi:hypothetical protein